MYKIQTRTQKPNNKYAQKKYVSEPKQRIMAAPRIKSEVNNTSPFGVKIRSLLSRTPMLSAHIARKFSFLPLMTKDIDI